MCSQDLDSEDKAALVNLKKLSLNGGDENAGLTGINMTTANYDDDDEDACNTRLYGGIAEIQAMCFALGYRAKVEVCPSHLPRNAIEPHLILSQSHLIPLRSHLTLLRSHLILLRSHLI